MPLQITWILVGLALSTATQPSPELERLQKILNMDRGRQPYEYNLEKEIPGILSRSRSEADTDRSLGTMIGLAVGDAVAKTRDEEDEKLGTAGYTEKTASALWMMCSLAIHGYPNLYDQLLRHMMWHEKGYLASDGKPQPDITELDNTVAKFMAWRKQRLAEAGMSPATPELCFQKIRSDAHERLHEALQSAVNVMVFQEGPGTGSEALVRVIPISVFDHDNRLWSVEKAHQATALTHGMGVSMDVSKVYTWYLISAQNGVPKERLLASDFIAKADCHLHLCTEVNKVVDGSYKAYTPGSGGAHLTALDTLEAALWAFFNDDGLFEIGIRRILSLDGDTNAIAAVYGALAGACYGLKNIPAEWVARLQHGKFIMDMSRVLNVRRSLLSPQPEEKDKNNFADERQRKVFVYILSGCLFILMLLVFALIDLTCSQETLDVIASLGVVSDQIARTRW